MKLVLKLLCIVNFNLAIENSLVYKTNLFDNKLMGHGRFLF